MVETIVGAIFGTVASVVISQIYYYRSSKDLREELDTLRDELSKLGEINNQLEDYVKEIARSLS